MNVRFVWWNDGVELIFEDSGFKIKCPYYYGIFQKIIQIQKIKHNDANSRLHAIFFICAKTSTLFSELTQKNSFRVFKSGSCKNLLMLLLLEFKCFFISLQSGGSFRELRLLSANGWMQLWENSQCLVSVDIQRLGVLLLIFSVESHFTLLLNCPSAVKKDG